MSDTQEKHESTAPEKSNPVAEIEIHLVRNPMFRVIYADGVWYEPNVNGTVRLSFFNEHVSLPDKVVAPAGDKGPSLKILRQESKGGLTREIEVHVVMSLAAAVLFHDFLGQNIQKLKEAIDKNKPEGATSK
jgi:hypothetical protein